MDNRNTIQKFQNIINKKEQNKNIDIVLDIYKSILFQLFIDMKQTFTHTKILKSSSFNYTKKPLGRLQNTQKCSSINVLFNYIIEYGRKYKNQKKLHIQSIPFFMPSKNHIDPYNQSNKDSNNIKYELIKNQDKDEKKCSQTSNPKVPLRTIHIKQERKTKTKEKNRRKNSNVKISSSSADSSKSIIFSFITTHYQYVFF
ncbi:hypothetical protein BDA99DRAFT_536841 [Phascolomyces articulosus]|uniref:Uncharacterized protein n=1 Tax=Phascolomyces articulosus TaxID=60185 RepID=A0AAD5KAW2_9FUNG|nr:hypothetical protein BDA99DRAFT_536841 [Phascolomyces articulosus]